MNSIWRILKSLLSTGFRKSLGIRRFHGDSLTNKLHAYRCYDGQIEVLSPIELDESMVAHGLSHSFFQNRGYVRVAGEVFDLTRDGLYRFYRLPSLSEQRIVCSSGFNSLMKTLGYCFKYGTSDNDTPVEDLLKALKIRPVVAGCQYLSELVILIGEYYGLSIRKVAVISIDPWNGQDDGHTLLEVKLDGRWIAYDPSFNCVFSSEGALLSLWDLCDLKMQGVELFRLPGYRESAPYNIGDYDYSFWVDKRGLSEEMLIDWYKHVLHVPLFLVSGVFSYPRSFVRTRDTKRFQRRYYSDVEDSELHNRFYKEA